MLELTVACNFCRGTGITSLFCLLIKVKQIHKFWSQVVQAEKCGSCPCPVYSSSSNKCQPSASPGTELTAPAASARDNPPPKGEGQLRSPPTWSPARSRIEQDHTRCLWRKRLSLGENAAIPLARKETTIM